MAGVGEKTAEGVGLEEGLGRPAVGCWYPGGKQLQGTGTWGQGGKQGLGASYGVLVWQVVTK